METYSEFTPRFKVNEQVLIKINGENFLGHISSIGPFDNYSETLKYSVKSGNFYFSRLETSIEKLKD